LGEGPNSDVDIAMCLGWVHQMAGSHATLGWASKEGKLDTGGGGRRSREGPRWEASKGGRLGKGELLCRDQLGQLMLGRGTVGGTAGMVWEGADGRVGACM